MEEKLRVLAVLTTPFGKNGITEVAMNYARHADPARATFDFVTLNELPAEDAARLDGLGGRRFVLPMRNKNPLSYLSHLSRIVRENRYDVVHAHGNSCTLLIEMAASQLGGCRVRIPHSHNTSCTHPKLNDFLRPAFDRSYTDAFACGLEAGLWLYGKRPFTVINNAIDVPRFAFSGSVREETRRALGFTDCRVLGTVGTLNARKNQTFLLDVLAELVREDPSYRLLLVGDGPARETLEAKAAALHLSDKVCFFGGTDAIPPLLFAMDAFLLPSLSEGLPLTLVEAQTAGLPCIASDAVTRQAAVTELLAYLPLTDSAARWAEGVRRLPMPDRALERERRMREIAEAGFDIDANAARLLELYRACVEGRR